MYIYICEQGRWGEEAFSFSQSQGVRQNTQLTTKDADEHTFEPFWHFDTSILPQNDSPGKVCLPLTSPTPFNQSLTLLLVFQLMLPIFAYFLPHCFYFNPFFTLSPLFSWPHFYLVEILHCSPTSNTGDKLCKGRRHLGPGHLNIITVIKIDFDKGQVTIRQACRSSFGRTSRFRRKAAVSGHWDRI